MTKVPDIKTTPPGPKAKEIVERDSESVATSTKTSPVVAKRAKGSIVEDVDGVLKVQDAAAGVKKVFTNMHRTHENH